MHDDYDDETQRIPNQDFLLIVFFIIIIEKTELWREEGQRERPFTLCFTPEISALVGTGPV